MSFLSIIQQTEQVNEVQFFEDPVVEGSWYRYEDSKGWGSQVWLRQFRVIRKTPRGVWLDDYGLERFVLNDARKRFAYPTVELAWESFLIRKQKQIAHLKNQLEHVGAVLKAAEERNG